MKENTVLRRNHLDMLYDFKDRHCSDPRDRYFGMFGIAQHERGGRFNLSPDYTISLQELHKRYITEIQHFIEDDPAIAAISESTLRQ
jgi:hypothetical protein